MLGAKQHSREKSGLSDMAPCVALVLTSPRSMPVVSGASTRRTDCRATDTFSRRSKPIVKKNLHVRDHTFGEPNAMNGPADEVP